MRSEAKTVREYLRSLPDDRRAAIGAVRDVISANLPDGYVEAMNWGMISYEVPLDVYPDSYNGKPLIYAGLASQKGYMVVYLTAIYADDGLRKRFESDYRATGKRYDVGQSCVRFKTLEDLPLDVIATAIASMPVANYVELYERQRHGPGKRPSATKSRPRSKQKGAVKGAKKK